MGDQTLSRKYSYTVACILALFLAVFFYKIVNAKESDPKKLKIAITHLNGLGEIEFAHRLRAIAIKKGHDSFIISLVPNPVIKRVAPHYKHALIAKKKPDMIISLQGGRIDRIPAKQYVALSHSSQYYLSANSSFPMQNAVDFDGLLVSFPDKERLTSFCTFMNAPCEYIDWFFTCAETPFNPVSNFNLVYFGTSFVNTRDTGKMFKQLFSLMDRAGYLNTYGAKDYWLHTPKSYRGLIKGDGKSVQRVVHNTGVALIIHAFDNFMGATPSARIFEAAAASAIVISDENPFIKKHFKDSVLYIDTTKSAENVFTQINGHMDWIRTHRDEAQSMAKKCHKIFIENFSLDKQFDRLIALYESQTSPSQLLKERAQAK